MDIKINNLSVSFASKEIFKNFNLTIEENKITCILGNSGIGKTTLLNAISGSVPYSGSIEKPNDDISFIYQNDRLIPHISIYKNLELVLKNKVKDKKERSKQIDNMLHLVELSGEAKAFPHQLSGGMQSRVSLARGFIYPSNILLMDECFKGLDSALKLRLIKVFINLYNASLRTTLFVTHSIDEALLVADRIIILRNSPCKIINDISIDTPKQNRSLLDGSMDSVRTTLLTSILN